jgi:hypothetical protein
MILSFGHALGTSSRLTWQLLTWSGRHEGGRFVRRFGRTTL